MLLRPLKALQLPLWVVLKEKKNAEGATLAIARITLAASMGVILDTNVIAAVNALKWCMMFAMAYRITLRS